MNQVRPAQFTGFFILLSLLASPWASSQGDSELAETADPPLVDTGGRLQIVDPVYQFGVIRAEEVESVKHSFTLKNSGSGPLSILRIEPTCECTESVVSATNLAPGQTATLSAVMKFEGKIGESSATIRIDSNDVTAPHQLVTFEGTVLVPWRVIPVQLDLGDLGRGEKAERILQVVSQYLEGDVPRRIVRLDSDRPEVRAATQEFALPRKDPGRPYVEVSRPVKVQVTAGKEIGSQNARLSISTDDPRGITQLVLVRWNVEGDLALSTKRLIVRRTGDKSFPVNLELKSRSGIPFEVLSIEAKSKEGHNHDLTITPLDSASPTEKRFRVEVSDKAKTGKPNLGEVVITTNHPEQEKVTLSYTASAIVPRGR